MILKDESGKIIKVGNTVHMPMNGMSVMRVMDVHEGLVEGGPPAHIVVQMTIGITPVKPDGTCPVYIVDRSKMDKLIDSSQII